PNRRYRLKDRPGCRFDLQAFVLLKIGIRQSRPPGGGQDESYAGDEPTPGLALEDAIAITKAAGVAVQPDPGFFVEVVGGDKLHEFADLDAIGANVLNRRGAHGARNERQVLQAAIAARDAPG